MPAARPTQNPVRAPLEDKTPRPHVVPASPPAAGDEGRREVVSSRLPSAVRVQQLATGPAASIPASTGKEGLSALSPQPSTLPKERHYRIHYGATGYSYETIFEDYLAGAEEITVEDPYIRAHHQIVNFLRFCETAVRIAKPKRILLVTSFDNTEEKDEATAKLATIIESLRQFDVQLEVRENPRLHDRQVRLSSGWTIKIGRGFDIYQRPDDWLQVGANDLDLRPCLETTVDIFPTK